MKKLQYWWRQGMGWLWKSQHLPCPLPISSPWCIANPIHVLRAHQRLLRWCPIPSRAHLFPTILTALSDLKPVWPWNKDQESQIYLLPTVDIRAKILQDGSKRRNKWETIVWKAIGISKPKIMQKKLCAGEVSELYWLLLPIHANKGLDFLSLKVLFVFFLITR